MTHLPIDGGSGGVPQTPDLPADIAPPAEAPWWPASKRALTFFGAGLAGLALSTLSGVALHHFVVASGLAFSTALLLLGVGWAAIALAKAFRSDEPRRAPGAAFLAVFPLLGGLFFAAVGTALTFWATGGFARGRQLRRRGKVLLPPVRDGAGWARQDLAVSAPEELRGPLADRWRANGRTEHASVAAFARLTLDLIALGAPAALIEAAHRDAMDEVRHTDLCFSIARALDGRLQGPGPFPAAQHAGGLSASRTLALAQLAVSSLIDGALHEGLSARVLARLAPRCREPAVQDAVRALAADEGRHAAHGWEVVEWCLAEGGAPVAQALRGALRGIPDAIDSDLPLAAQGGAWEAHGIHGLALEAAEHGKARADLHRRVLLLTAGDCRRNPD